MRGIIQLQKLKRHKQNRKKPKRDYEAEAIAKKNNNDSVNAPEGDWSWDRDNDVELYYPESDFSKIFGAKVSVGKEKSYPTQYYIFATVENGTGYSKEFGDDKPINVYASAGEHWWEFWEWSLGIDVNINGYGAGISVGGETSINIHAGNISHEVGVNSLGRVSYKFAHNAGDGYVYTKYSLNGPEIVAVAAYYAAPVVIPAVATALQSLGGMVPVGVG